MAFISQGAAHLASVTKWLDPWTMCQTGDPMTKRCGLRETERRAEWTRMRSTGWN
jgi:hypothetical protein